MGEIEVVCSYCGSLGPDAAHPSHDCASILKSQLAAKTAECESLNRLADAHRLGMRCLREERDALQADKARLDWLEAQATDNAKAVLSWGWVARESETGRGYRLHQSTRIPNYTTARDAIDAARQPRSEEQSNVEIGPRVPAMRGEG